MAKQKVNSQKFQILQLRPAKRCKIHRSALVGIESPLWNGQMWTSHYLWEMLNLDPFFQQKQHPASKFMFVSATSKHNDFIVMDWMIPLLWDFSSCLSKCATWANKMTSEHGLSECLSAFQLLLWYETIFGHLSDSLCDCKMGNCMFWIGRWLKSTSV